MAATTAFEPPGPGRWSLDRSHYPGGTTPISDWLITESMSAGMQRVFGELGAPVRRIDSRFVNGFHYTRVVPLVRGDRPATRLPPLIVLKVVTRIHPEFRRRERRASETLATMPSLAVADDWAREIRPRLVEQNRALQEFDVERADDAALDRHVGELLDHLRESVELHFWLHGHDLGPIARFIHACETRWSIPGVEAVQSLAGASPATVVPAETLYKIHVEVAGRPVTTLDEVRACSVEAAALLDGYLDEHGCRLVTGYDITSLTLNELPGLVVESIRSARVPPTHNGDEAAALRLRVPADERAEFDRYLEATRGVMDMRDDNGPQTAEWPLGILRRALLEAGRRLQARGALIEAEHALDLTPQEARHALSGKLPSAEQIAERSQRRLELADLDPPVTLGPAEPEPPLDVMPAQLADVVAMIQTSLAHLGMDANQNVEGTSGVGVGSETYIGRVCRAANADEAISKIEPGDVLLVRATSPAFNAVLTMAGAVVTANGGAMSHAAVLARELGIPAVVGAASALEIEDGATIEVDPVAGRVRVLS